MDEIEYKGETYLGTNRWFMKDKNDAIRLYRIQLKNKKRVLLLCDGELWRMFTHHKDVMIGTTHTARLARGF